MEYQHELSRKFVEFVKERILDEKKFMVDVKSQGMMDKRIQRLRDDMEGKMKLIDDFKRHVEWSDWSAKCKELAKAEFTTKHIDFIESIQTDKVYHQQIYAAEKIIVHEDRMRKRKLDLNFEH